jgi:hypothetical protein
MSGGGFFSYGNADPLLLLLAGFVVVGLLAAVAAIAIRLSADSELTTGESQPQVDSSIALLVISVLLSIIGAVLYHYSPAESGIAMVFIIVGIFLLWPVSALLAVRGRGSGREALLVGHGLIALLVLVLLLSILIHAS